LLFLKNKKRDPKKEHQKKGSKTEFDEKEFSTIDKNILFRANPFYLFGIVKSKSYSHYTKIIKKIKNGAISP